VRPDETLIQKRFEFLDIRVEYRLMKSRLDRGDFFLRFICRPGNLRRLPIDYLPLAVAFQKGATVKKLCNLD
jgi:hypothetical protein